MDKIQAFKVDLIKEKEGGYTVVVPLLPGCISYGRTVEEATKNAKEAIELHLENLEAHDQPVPEEDSSLVFSTLVQVTHNRV